MNYLKTKLSFSFVFLTVLVIIYAIIITNFNPTSYYSGREKQIVGIVQTIKYDEDKVTITLKAKEKVLGYYYLKNNEKVNLKLGVKVKLNGKLEMPTVNTNQNLFNYRNYLLSQKIKWIFIIDNYEIVNNRVNLFYDIKNKINDRIDKAILSKDYLKTFILGENNISKDIKESYQINGVSHLLAISGMHITLLATIVLTILNKVIDQKKSYLITVVIVFAYAFLTGFKPPVIRASFLFLLLTINRFGNFSINSLNYLITLALILLVCNPYYIYDLGFKFSFIVSFYIMLFSNLINSQNGYLRKMFLLSLIAFVSGFPILINNFFMVNLLTPIINVIFVPFVSLVVFPLILITFLFPWLDPALFNIITMMENLSLLIEKFDLLVIPFSKVSIVIIIIYYFIIIICLLKNNLNYWLVFIFILTIHYCLPYLNNSFEIHMLDVGQGDSILIKWPKNELNILVDTGGIISKRESYLTKNTLIPYFCSLGVRKIDYLILTHGDYDHMGEATYLVNNFKVEKVIFNNDDYNDLEKELIKLLEKKNIKYYKGLEEINMDNNKLQFLNTKIYDNENDNSNVIYFNYNYYKFLFMGDAGIDKERDILDKYNLENIDFLKVGHHGSNTSSSEDFIDGINPKYSLISVGKNNRYGHPKESVLDNLSNSQIYRTDLDGSIEIKINNGRYEIITCTS